MTTTDSTRRARAVGIQRDANVCTQVIIDSTVP